MPRYRAFLLFLVSVVSYAARANVQVWEGTLTLPTYEEGSPDPNPPFDIFQTTRFNYPYTLRENLTNNRVDHAWRAIYLENEYLKCTVLPDIGGHLYTCVDKLSGQPMFYANPSIKKAQIGYRGAWAAFGVEFNFPVSHNWVSMSPVDFAYAKGADGSASVTVGNIDRVYGMEWSVQMVLRPGSTLLEERVTLSNRSDVRHRFYWWNNAGVQVWDDSQIQYPMRYVASHGFTEVKPWPVDANGKDLSIIRNQTDGPVSLFVHGSREPFMGVWHPHTNTGVVHFANYAELPGKKIWSWGSDPDGLDWRKALSDNESAYVEVQGGLFRNQETYAFLQPRQTIRFSEYWMPVRDLGGIARANLVGVINLSRQQDKLLASFNSNQDIPHASIRLLDSGRRLSEERVDLAPARNWKHEFAIPNPQSRYTLVVADASGAVLLQHTEGEYDWAPPDEIHVGPQPAYVVPPSTQRTEDDWLQLGEDEELNGKTLAALDTYKEGLAKFQQSLALHKAAGRTAVCLLRYEEAVRHLAPVQEHNMTDPEASYYLAIAYDALGDNWKARADYERAHRLPQYRAAAALRLAEFEARQGRLREAKSYLEKSLRAAPDDVRGAEELVAIRDALGETSTARTLAQEWLQRCPLSYFLREELGNPDLPHLGADADRVLNIAAEYIRLGLYKRALQVLSRNYPPSPPDHSEPGAVLPQNHVMVAYFRAYCEEKLDHSAEQDYVAASQLSTRYIFPNRPEALDILHAALRARPSDGTAHYLLGTLLFSRGLTDAAIEEWNAAAKFAPRTPVLHADLGKALLRVKRDASAALPVFQDGIAVDPKNAELYAGMDQALSILERPASDRVHALEQYPDLAHMSAALVYELALNRAEAGDFKGAEDLFRDRFFPREEGGTNVRQVWVEVRLQEAMSLQYEGNCSAATSMAANLGREVLGFPFTRDGLEPLIDAARTQYLIGVLLSRCGQPQEARADFERAAQHAEPAQIFWAYAAAKKLGHIDTADWQQKLESSLARIKANSESGSNSLELYIEGLLESALGRSQEADAAFQDALLLPDHMMAHHLSRLARPQSTPE
jgi:tetratricopeptide (TPR) repeat protein